MGTTPFTHIRQSTKHSQLTNIDSISLETFILH